ncbi:MAG: flavodoxin family protein [Synergistaceae bacterium]|nr:flavodoxin family protein [Synergistaceae bacterium]
MKVLLINGSPNEHGCTFTALSEVAGTLNKRGVETEIFWIGKKAIHGCIACWSCTKLGKCVFDDDGVNALAARLDEFDGFVLGAPVYYAGVAGSMCSFLDRLFFSGDESGEKFANKPGACVVSCRRGGASAAFDRINKYFTIRNMPIVSSQYWNQVHGNTPDEVKQDLEGLQTMRTLGENMAWLLKCIEAGKKAGVPAPEREEIVFTNFIR